MQQNGRIYRIRIYDHLYCLNKVSGVVIMIETVVSVDLMVEEELKVKKNHLTPDFPTGGSR